MARLKNPNGYVRAGAAERLGKLGDARAVEPLIGALDDATWAVRRKAAEALGKLGDARAVEPLIRCVKEGDADTRDTAIEALVKLGKPAVEPLIACLKDEDPFVRQRAAHTLAKLGWSPANDAQRAAVLWAKGDWDALVKMGKPAVEPLLELLEHADPQLRSDAGLALGQLGDPRAVGPLVSRLRDDFVECLRVYAAEALVKLGKPAVQPLIGCLRDNDHTVRARAAQTLGKLGDAGAVEPLIACLGDGVDKVREAAAEALGDLGDPRAIEPLTRCLKDEEWAVRQSAALALDKLRKEPGNR